jgi:hypothetical protein
MVTLRFKSFVTNPENGQGTGLTDSSILKRKGLRTTLVSVEVETANGVVVLCGASKQSAKDHDKRALGQKYALSNALKHDTDLTYDERKLVWIAFFKFSRKTAALCKK